MTIQQLWAKLGRLARILQDHQHTGSDGSAVFPISTYTPFLGGDGGDGTHTYSTQTGWYQRLGNLIIAEFHLALTNKNTSGTLTGNVYVSLPIAAANAVIDAGWMGYYGTVDLTAGYSQLSCYVASATARAFLVQSGDNVGAALIGAAAIANTTEIRGGMIYRIA